MNSKEKINIKPTYLEVVEKIRELCSTDKDFTEKTKDLIVFIGKVDEEKEVLFKEYWCNT